MRQGGSGTGRAGRTGRAPPRGAESTAGSKVRETQRGCEPPAPGLGASRPGEGMGRQTCGPRWPPACWGPWCPQGLGSTREFWESQGQPEDECRAGWCQAWHCSFLPGLAPGSRPRGSGSPTGLLCEDTPLPGQRGSGQEACAPARRWHLSLHCVARPQRLGVPSLALEPWSPGGRGCSESSGPPGEVEGPAPARLNRTLRGWAGSQEVPRGDAARSLVSSVAGHSVPWLSLLCRSPAVSRPPPARPSAAGGSVLCCGFWGQEASPSGTLPWWWRRGKGGSGDLSCHLSPLSSLPSDPCLASRTAASREPLAKDCGKGNLVASQGGGK